MPPSITQLTYWLISDRLRQHHALGPRLGARRCTSAAAGRRRRPRPRGRRPGPSVHQASTSSQPASGAAPDSGIQPRTPPSMPAAASAFSAVAASASSATIPLGPGVPQDVGDLVGAEHEVDRHEDDAELRGGERQDGVLPGVVRQQREPVALGQAAVGQRVRGPVHRGVELGVGDRAGRRPRRRACPGTGGRCGAAGRRRSAGGTARSAALVSGLNGMRSR